MKNLNFLSTAIVAMVTLLSGGLSAFAHDFEVDGIFYNITDEVNKTVAVTFKGKKYNSKKVYKESVKIPASVTYKGTTYSVTEIGEDAFCLCHDLTSITIPNSVTEIGEGAFEYCSLTSITIPNSVSKIGNDAFDGCDELKDLIIEDGTEILSLGYNIDYRYEYSKNHQRQWIKITEGLFHDCPLEKLYIGRNLSYNSGSEYGYSPFYCRPLIEFSIGNSVTSIGNYAFFGCDRLTSVTIPNSVTTIGESAFFGCDRLTSVTIPNSVTSIGNHAFSRCSNLSTVSFNA